jgi:hypothetical protein
MSTFTLHPEGRERVLSNLHAFLDRLPLGQAWDVHIAKHRKARTIKQCAALFGVAYPAIRDQTGEDDIKRLHEHFCGEYFGWKENPLGYRKPMRTTTKDYDGKRAVISTEEMAAFYAFVQRRCAEVGVDVPDPVPRIPC